MKELYLVAAAMDHVAAALAITAGAWWFFRTARDQQRIFFDVACTFFNIPGNSEMSIAQIEFVFENKGFVEHRIWDLTFSLHAIAEDVKTKNNTQDLVLDKPLYRRVPIVSKKYNYYFVRPGVKQPIVHAVLISSGIRLISVTGSFCYNRNSAWPHTIRRIFQKPSSDPRLS
jgi:hypothetical protein